MSWLYTAQALSSVRVLVVHPCWRRGYTENISRRKETESNLLACFGRRLFSEANTENGVELISAFRLSTLLRKKHTRNGVGLITVFRSSTLLRNKHKKRSRAYYCVSVVDSSQKQTQETESSLLTSFCRRLFQKQTQETELFISFFIVFHRLTVV